MGASPLPKQQRGTLRYKSFPLRAARRRSCVPPIIAAPSSARQQSDERECGKRDHFRTDSWRCQCPEIRTTTHEDRPPTTSPIASAKTHSRGYEYISPLRLRAIIKPPPRRNDQPLQWNILYTSLNLAFSVPNLTAIGEYTHIYIYIHMEPDLHRRR